MSKIRDGDEMGTGKTTPLYAAEKRRIQPGPMDWGLMMAKVKAISTLSTASLTGTVLAAVFPTARWTSQGMIELAESINADIRAWIDGYEQLNPPRLQVRGFRYHWKLLRTWVPLQFRLAVEQVLWEKGGPWRALVTGFGAIDPD